jgi:hypothetical protein
MDDLTLTGGVNALQFIGPLDFANATSDVQISNAKIRDTSL